MVNWIGYTKALHLIFMVSWFAGLFYMVRLFVYYAESDDNHGELSSAFKKQYLLMQKRLWYIISWPSMLFTILFGLITLFSNQYEYLLGESYMHVKLGFVGLLVTYHFYVILFILTNSKISPNIQGCKCGFGMKLLLFLVIITL